MWGRGKPPGVRPTAVRPRVRRRAQADGPLAALVKAHLALVQLPRRAPARSRFPPAQRRAGAACSIRARRCRRSTTRALIVSTAAPSRASPSRGSASARTAARWARSAWNFAVAFGQLGAGGVQRLRVSASSASSGLRSVTSTCWASASSASGSVSPATARRRDVRCRTDAFGQWGQRERGVLDRLGAGPTAASCAVSPAGCGQAGIVVLAADGRPRPRGWRRAGLPVDQVVGGEPQPGVAQVGLHGLGRDGRPAWPPTA